MKSPVVKRSIVVAGHKTSVSLEEAFWNGMKEISGLRNVTLSELVGEIDNNRQQGNLSSAIRLFVLDYFRSRAQAATPGRAAHFRGRGMPSYSVFRLSAWQPLQRKRSSLIWVLNSSDFLARLA